MRQALLYIVRIVGALFILLSILNPTLSYLTDTRPISVLLDVSDSMSPTDGNALLHDLKKFDQNGSVEVFPFARLVSPYSVSLQSITDFKTLRRSWENLDIGHSDIEGALNSIPSKQDVLLLSDGFEHGGDVLQALPSLFNQKVRVFPLIPSTSEQAAGVFRITQIDAPLTVPRNVSIPIRVGIENSTPSAKRGTVKVFHGPKEILTKKIELQAGKELLVVAQSDSTLSGLQEVRAELIPDEKEAQPSKEVTYLSNAKREKVFLLSGTSDDARFLKEILSHQSFEVNEVVVEGSTVSIDSLDQYAAVIFNNVSLKQLPAQTPESIRSFVEKGGSFLMIGGARSFGLGGYRDTAIEQVLPVFMVPPQTEQKRLNVAVILVLDKSQSMGADQKIEFVKDAARQVVQSLKSDDYLGVIGFDERPFLALPIGRLSDIRDVAVNQIGQLFPTGPTRLLPALQLAAQQIERAPAGRKHIIVLTDGKLPDGGPMYIDATKQFRMLGITLSTILLGGEAYYYPLREMADAGGGTFYQTTDPNVLPKVFINDIKVSTGEKTLKELQEYDVRKGPGGIKSISLSSFPPLKGYVQTKPKDGAAIELVAYSGELAEPLLATWGFGRGRVAAFTSDANGRWSSSWISWPRFEQFWSELLQSLVSEQGDKTIRFDVRPLVEGGSVSAEVTVYTPMKEALRGSALYPDGSRKNISFELLAEGRLKASLDKPMPGKYQLDLSFGNKQLSPVSFYVSGESFGEQQGKGFNTSLLETIAQKTGGVVNPEIDQLHFKNSEGGKHGKMFLLVGTLLLLLEIYLREISSPR